MVFGISVSREPVSILRLVIDAESQNYVHPMPPKVAATSAG